MGPAENWGASEWYALRDKYLDPETEFAHLAKAKQTQQAQQQAVEPEPVPEKTDRQLAIDDVMATLQEIAAKPELSGAVMDAGGNLHPHLIQRWTGKERTS